MLRWNPGELHQILNLRNTPKFFFLFHLSQQVLQFRVTVRVKSENWQRAAWNNIAVPIVWWRLVCHAALQRCVTCHDTDRGDQDFKDKKKTLRTIICPQTAAEGHMGKRWAGAAALRARRDSLAGPRWPRHSGIQPVINGLQVCQMGRSLWADGRQVRVEVGGAAPPTHTLTLSVITYEKSTLRECLRMLDGHPVHPDCTTCTSAGRQKKNPESSPKE